MTVARSQLVDLDITHWYHCISHCVRHAGLGGKGKEHRKGWLEDRLETLTDIFAVSVCSFSLMDNHMHVVVRLEGPALVDQWSDEEVAARWARLYPPKDKRRRAVKNLKAWIKKKAKDAAWITKIRERLASLSWFMKCLKEPLARMANQEDGCRGVFWEPRFKSIALLDTEALLAACAYVDLNPVAAGAAKTPEASEHTSLHARLEVCRQEGRMPTLREALGQTAEGRALPAEAAAELEGQVWLVRFADRSSRAADPGGGGEEALRQRRGLLDGFSLPQYLHLIDWSSRLVRKGKAHVHAKAAPILERLGGGSEMWTKTLKRLFDEDRLVGVALAFSRKALDQAAQQRGCHHVVNLCRCPV